MKDSNSTPTGVKTLLAVMFAIFLGVLSYSSLSYVDNYSKSIEPSSFRSFWVTGEAKGVTVPDIAEFTFSVISEGKTDIGKLQQENTEKMNKAIAFVKSKGIKAEDIITQNYQVDPRYDYSSCDGSEKICPPPSISGYTITQSVNVKIRDFDNISGLLTGVVDAGANSVSQLNFTLDDPTEIQNSVREKAIAKAKVKAENIADAAGVRLGRLLEIQEGYVSTPYSRTNVAMDMMVKNESYAGQAPMIEPGVQEINLSIQLKYEIE